MNCDLLREVLKEKGVRVEDLADMIGVNRATMYRKMKKLERTTIGEAVKIKAALNLSDALAYQIFLA